MRVCVLISGRGSNMESLIRRADGYTVEAVISNKPDAAGLRVADGLGVRCMAEPSLDGIRDILDGMRPDLVCMAGFMRILPADLTERYRVMNIHPALLPRYPGLRGRRAGAERRRDPQRLYRALRRQRRGHRQDNSPSGGPSRAGGIRLTLWPPAYWSGSTGCIQRRSGGTPPDWQRGAAESRPCGGETRR